MSAFIILNDGAARRIIKQVGLDLGEHPKELRKITVRALNRAIENARTGAVREIRARYNVPAADVRQAMRLSKPSIRLPVAALRLRGRVAVPLVRFGAKKSKKGVTVKVLKASARSLVVKSGIKAFLAKEQVMVRKGKERLPVRKLYGPGFIEFLNRQEVKSSLEAAAREVFERRVTHEAGRLLAKTGGA